MDPAKAPAAPKYIEIGFEKGIPVCLDGVRMDGVKLIETLNELAGKYGVGRIDHVEDRLVGIKSRETYECPAAITLIAAHRGLEALTLPKDTIEFKRIIEQNFSQLIYDGLWYEGLRENLQAFIDSSQEYVTGVVRIKLYKGTATVVGRRSPYSLYDVGLSTYAKGDEFDVMEQVCAESGKGKVSFSPDAIRLLQERHWPGNIRELRNVVERLLILGGNPVSAKDIKDFV